MASSSSKRARRAVALTDEQVAQFYDCRCADGPDVHSAGYCARVRAARDIAAPTTDNPR